jgi:ADP-heptose:LPS heptosyltransferase
LLDFARALECDVTDATPTFCVDDAQRGAARRALAAAGLEGPYVVLHPTRGIAATRERWPVARLAALGRALGAETGMPVVVSGGASDAAIAAAVAEGAGGVSLAGRLSIGEFGALAENSFAVVALDSGPMHVAAAVGAPTVGIFALRSDEPARWAPLGPRTAVVLPDYPCPPQHRKETCPDFACIANLEIPRVLGALRGLLAVPVEAQARGNAET